MGWRALMDSDSGNTIMGLLNSIKCEEFLDWLRNY
jgi:hypothetical protein